eukprot:283800-Alexandrium_andersonii.AAC.1
MATDSRWLPEVWSETVGLNSEAGGCDRNEMESPSREIGFGFVSVSCVRERHACVRACVPACVRS